MYTFLCEDFFYIGIYECIVGQLSPCLCTRHIEKLVVSIGVEKSVPLTEGSFGRCNRGIQSIKDLVVKDSISNILRHSPAIDSQLQVSRSGLSGGIRVSEISPTFPRGGNVARSQGETVVSGRGG